MYIRLSVLGILFLCACTPVNKDAEKIEKMEPPPFKDVQPNDTPKFVVINFDTTKSWLFTNSTNAILTVNDEKCIEEILSKAVANFNISQLKIYKNGHFKIDISNYKRQYIAVINSKRDKIVWVNCFCQTSGEFWRNKIVHSYDGGECYFNLKINLSNKSYFDFKLNGNA